MSSLELEAVAFEAEDEGYDAYIAYDEHDVVRYIEIDGMIYDNEDYDIESEEAFWMRDADRIADRLWRQ